MHTKCTQNAVNINENIGYFRTHSYVSTCRYSFVITTLVITYYIWRFYATEEEPYIWLRFCTKLKVVREQLFLRDISVPFRYNSGIRTENVFFGAKKKNETRLGVHRRSKVDVHILVYTRPYDAVECSRTRRRSRPSYRSQKLRSQTARREGCHLVYRYARVSREYPTWWYIRAIQGDRVPLRFSVVFRSFGTFFFSP